MSMGLVRFQQAEDERHISGQELPWNGIFGRLADARETYEGTAKLLDHRKELERNRHV
jgi:hypothetical protein